MSTSSTVPLFASMAELDAYLARANRRFHDAHWGGAAVHLDIIREIHAEVKDELRTCHAVISREAHKAEVHDHEACRLLGTILADGAVTRDELPALRRAARLVHRSAEADHRIGELAKA